MGIKEALVARYNQEDTVPFMFEIGQMVRVLNNVSDDGQTPVVWNGAKAKVLSRRSTSIHKTHVYEVEHLATGAIETFKCEELDFRFAKKQK